MMAESCGTHEAVGHVGSTVSKPREKQIGAPLTFSLLYNPGARPRITPPPSYPSLVTPSFTDICPRGDSRPCQIDNKYHITITYLHNQGPELLSGDFNPI